MTTTDIPTDEQLRRDYDARRHEEDLMREQPLTHMEAEGQPSAAAMGAESAEYTKPLIDPQWTAAWKMFVDSEGEYGVLVHVPRGQWSGVPDALNTVRRPDGGHWFQLSTPPRVKKGVYACFVGDCTKMLHRRIQLVSHVRAFHVAEAQTFKTILERIEKQVADEDPRLQKLLASLKLDETGDPAPDDGPPAGIAEMTAFCLEPDCGKQSPDGHANPARWLQGHMLGAHKQKVSAE